MQHSAVSIFNLYNLSTNNLLSSFFPSSKAESVGKISTDGDTKMVLGTKRPGVSFILPWNKFAKSDKNPFTQEPLLLKGYIPN